jgi:hypothetical protein
MAGAQRRCCFRHSGGARDRESGSAVGVKITAESIDKTASATPAISGDVSAQQPCEQPGRQPAKASARGASRTTARRHPKQWRPARGRTRSTRSRLENRRPRQASTRPSQRPARAWVRSASRSSRPRRAAPSRRCCLRADRRRRVGGDGVHPRHSVYQAPATDWSRLSVSTLA